MFLLIPQEILEFQDLTGDEKMLLSYIYHFSRKNKWMYASIDYLKRSLGLKDPADILNSLLEKDLIKGSSRGYATTRGVLLLVKPKLKVKEWQKSHS